MFKIRELKEGEICFETNLPIESITDHTGTTTFIYMDERMLDKFAFELWAYCMDKSLRTMGQP